jgi:zeta-carotene desaturase
VPLSDLYGSAIDYIKQRGGQVLLRTSVTALAPNDSGVKVTTAANNTNDAQQFEYAVLAVPFQNAAALLPQDALAEPLNQKLAKFEASPITGIHLWFDREVTPLPHAVLLDRTIQWMFQKSKLHEGRANVSTGSYLELVVSASRSLVEKSRQEIIDLAMAELAEFFPGVREAKLLKATVIKEVYATYSVLPGLDQYRPAFQTAWPRLFLAGDWTATAWPATMEGAVRSGYMAAESLAQAANTPQKILTADLPARGLMRMFR